MKRMLLIVFVASMTTLNTFLPNVARAGCNDLSSKAGFFYTIQFPTWYKYLDESQFGEDCSVKNFNFAKDTWKVGLAILDMLLRLAGIVAFVFTVWGGYKFVLSRGNPQEAAKARQTIIDAIIGMAIASIATVVVAFIGRSLQQ